MDAASIAELFHPIGSVRLKRMFGGHGIYADDLFFALESAGEIFLKTDAVTQSGVRRRRFTAVQLRSGGKDHGHELLALAGDGLR